LEAIEALTDGLLAYDGTVIFVSHDRWVVSKLATRIVELTFEGYRDFPGTYEEYIERLGDDHLDADVALARARKDAKAKKQGLPSASAPGDERERKKRGKDL